MHDLFKSICLAKKSYTSNHRSKAVVYIFGKCSWKYGFGNTTSLNYVGHDLTCDHSFPTMLLGNTKQWHCHILSVVSAFSSISSPVFIPSHSYSFVNWLVLLVPNFLPHVSCVFIPPYCFSSFSVRCIVHGIKVYITLRYYVALLDLALKCWKTCFTAHIFRAMTLRSLEVINLHHPTGLVYSQLLQEEPLG